MVDRRRRGELVRTVTALRDGGASALELGIPFSDPIADGPVLEAAHDRALAHGTGWNDVVAAVRTASTVLPTAVMTYANPLVRRGAAGALSELAAAGASGIIVPDLSLEESGPFRRAARRARVDEILLAAPGIDRARLARIARASRGFLYLVGHYGTTGGSARGSTVGLAPFVAAARDAAPALPVLIGFGVRDRASAQRALASGADGVVVGTALEELLRRRAGPRAMSELVRSIVAAPRSVPRGTR